jgi:hypothetical protein
MDRFIQQYEEKIIGHLSGFDRLVLRGTLRALAVKSGMLNYLWYAKVLLKDLGEFFKKKSEQLKAASSEKAHRLKRPIIYLPSAQTNKEEVAWKIAERDGIQEGLICILTSVELCQSYEVFRNPEKKILELEPRRRKCLFLYHYWIDPVFGFMNGRIQSWFPFSIQICLNGREWLSRQMDAVGLRYHRRDNCFPWIEDQEEARQMMERQLKTDWPSALGRIAQELNPAHQEMLAPYRVDYYWSTHQSEWATDIMFQSPQSLAEIYPTLVRSGILVFGSRDVMRFLGKKPNGNMTGEVTSHYRQRPEGIRVKHEVKGNAVKIYDKEGQVLRVETTVNNPRDFRVYRPKEGDSSGSPSWQRMRKGVADLYHRAEISEASNRRYLDALASIQVDQPLGEVVGSICRTTRWKSQRVRALRPWSSEDTLLFEAISRGEFKINGFRNRDLRDLLFPDQQDQKIGKRLSARITHRLRMLRAHRMIRKVPHSSRYILTRRGQIITSAIIQAQHINITKLSQLAA